MHAVAVAAAQGGPNSTFVLILIAAVCVAVFWRSLVKVGLALVVVLFAVLLFVSTTAVIHGIHLLIP